MAENKILEVTHKLPFNMREEFLKFMHHEETDWIPNYLIATVDKGRRDCLWLDHGGNGETDGFGVKWIGTSSGMGATTPDPARELVDELGDWRDKIVFPDVDAYDWAGEAAPFEQKIDRTCQCAEFTFATGHFERLVAHMGYENACTAFYFEPEKVAEFFDAFTEYRIREIDHAVEYFHPDLITYADDICTQNGPFMSPDTYREFLKPHQKRIVDAIHAHGVSAGYHCCGNAESLVADYVDVGWDVWSSVQPMNDICGILDRYGDKISLIGGYDTNGRPAMEDASLEEIVAEIHRCYDTYGPYRGYAFVGLILPNSDDPADMVRVSMPLITEGLAYSLKLYAQKLPAEQAAALMQALSQAPVLG